jgi:uncharacterized SAM-binding protein YcdF (DUF218 family)
MSFMSLLVTLIIAVFGVVRAWWLYRGRSERSLRWYLQWLIPLVAGVTVALRLGLVRSWLECEKFIAACIEPEGLIWLATLALACVALARRQRLLAACLGALWLMITLNGNAYVAAVALRHLERQVPVPDITGQVFDCVEVLGGGTDITSGGVPELGESGDRITCAFQLYHDGRARRLIASGSAPDFMGHPRSGLTRQEAAVLWHGMGVPDQDILEWPEPQTTSQEIARLAMEARSRGWTRIAVVSSAWHLPRVMRLCQEAQLTVTPIPCDYRGMPEPWSVVYLVPHGKFAFYVQLAVWEYLAGLAGR